MAGDLEPMPMSPRQSPSQLGGVVLQWVKGRRGRALAMSAVFVLFILGLAGMRHSDVSYTIFGETSTKSQYWQKEAETLTWNQKWWI